MDGDVGEGGCHDAADPVGGGVQVVEPVAPEGGELGVGANDAVEEREDDEEEREDLFMMRVRGVLEIARACWVG